MDVLTSETYWALNKEIIKEVTSSWSLFTQLLRSFLRTFPFILGGLKWQCVVVRLQLACSLRVQLYDFYKRAFFAYVSCFYYTSVLTTLSRTLLEKSVFHQLLKFPAIYGTGMFITILTTARHLSVSLAKLILIHSTPSHSVYWRPILILSIYTKIFPVASLPHVYPPQWVG